MHAADEDSSAPGAPVLLYDAVKELFCDLAAAYERGVAPRPDALLTGIAAFDDVVGGFVPGEVTVLSGAAAIGKTALACQLAAGVAAHGDDARTRVAALYVTTHGRAADIARRIVLSRARDAFVVGVEATRLLLQVGDDGVRDRRVGLAVAKE